MTSTDKSANIFFTPTMTMMRRKSTDRLIVSDYRIRCMVAYRIRNIYIYIYITNSTAALLTYHILKNFGYFTRHRNTTQFKQKTNVLNKHVCIYIPTYWLRQ